MVCFIFLFHLRSAFVAIVSLPLGILMAFIVMRYQGVNANIMSLGGIAIAIGAMVDAAVVMIENAHKHLERWAMSIRPEARRRGPLAGDRRLGGRGRAGAVLLAADHHAQLHPGFHAGGAEGGCSRRWPSPRPTRCDGGRGPGGDPDPGADGLPDPRAHSRREDQPAEPAADRDLPADAERVLRAPKLTLLVAAVALVVSLWPLQHIGGEFMPRLDEGDLLYMPSALPRPVGRQGGGAAAADGRLIKTVPEVASVYGKAGRAETATDPAPMEMFETTIQFKPKDQWRPGMTQDKLVDELDRIVKVPGVPTSGAADPQPDRHAGHRHQEPGRRQVAGTDLTP